MSHFVTLETKNDEYSNCTLYPNASDESYVFNTGDVVVDWWNMMEFVVTKLPVSGLSFSSSVDHFIGDTSYEFRYLNVTEFPMTLSKQPRGMRFIVPAGTEDILDWECFKEKYKL